MAVTMARWTAGARPGADDEARRVTAGHLLAGLAGEQDGNAGRLLRRRYAGIDVKLSTHAGLAAPDLPSLDAVLLATPAWPRPLWSDDLLAAVLRVGRDGLADLLDALGLAMGADVPTAGATLPTPEDLAEQNLTHETRGSGRLLAQGFDEETDRLVALARARGDDAAILLELLEPGSSAASLPGRAGIEDAVTAAIAAGEAPITRATLLPATLTVLLRSIAAT